MITWSTVRSFGNVKYFNVSYVILIAVPILAELHHKAATSSDSFASTVAFPAMLRWLYAASLFYALAIAIYQYFCPSIVKTYANMEDYLDKNHEIFFRSHPQHRLNIVLTHLDPEVDSELQAMIQQLIDRRDNSVGTDRAKAEEELEVILNKLHPDAIQRFLTKDWALKNVKFRPALWISFALYVVGTAIVVVLLIKRSFHVFYFT
jgi:hypothetical protein